MNKSQLVVRATELGVAIEAKDTKEILLEKISAHLEEAGDKDALVAFLNENGFTIDAEGNVVKMSRRRTLGENPQTKAFLTIKVLQDDSLEHLSYGELAKFLSETEGVDTTANSISWYANWMKQRSMPVVARKKAKKEKAEKAPAEEAAPEVEGSDEV
jgi:hypothetical protein